MRDLRNAALFVPVDLGALFQEELAPARHGARVEKTRYGPAAFGNYDGVLGDDAATD